MTEPAKRLRIALDYDGTYTADSELWDAFIALARARGHLVLCVSCRRPTAENYEECKVPVPIHFTSLAAKDWHMKQRGLPIDIWIDDEPRAITEGR